MKLKMLTLVLASIAPLSLWAAGPDGATEQFTVSQATMVPGSTLKPGTYSIHVMDHLQDRFVLRIEGGGDHSLFLGVPAPALKSEASSGVVAYGTAPDGKSALRGFVFKSGHTSIEFVYPKNDAVALAKLNEKKVLAVDPMSEGKSDNIASLNKDEMQMVSLWLLTPQPVGGGGGEPTISASKYDQQVASLTPHRPPMKSLPHTASPLPAIFLAGLITALSAMILRRLRASSSAIV